MKSNILNFSRNNKALLIVGSVLVGLSIINLIYFGTLVARDVTTGNVIPPNNLPRTNYGPFSAYHLEYASIFIFIFGAILLSFGAIGYRKGSHGTV